jgi:hypothetical protein
MTPESAMNQAISESGSLKLNPRDFQNSSWLSKAEQQIAAGQFDVAWYSPACAGQQAPPLNLLSTASGIGLSATAATTGILSAAHMIPAIAVPVVGWVIAGVGALVGIISTIFQHHAAAVKRDLAFGCSALPAVNNAFSVIAQGVQSGNIKPNDAAGALDHIVSEFQSAGGAAINDSPWCNSNCEMEVILKGMVIYWKAQYGALAAQQAYEAAQAVASQGSTPSLTQSDLSPTVPVSASQALSPTSTPGGTSGFSLSAVPAWGWLLAAAFGAWAVL